MTNRKDAVCLDSKILCESSVLGHAIGPQIQAQQKVAAHAIKAFAARFVAIPDDPLTLFEVLNSRPELDNFAGKFMPGNQGETWSELSLMDMKIRAANSASVYSNQHVVGFDLWFRHILILELSWSVVNDGFHVVGKDLVHRGCRPPRGAKLMFANVVCGLL